MHVLILEAALTGHHSIYLERIAGCYLSAGHSVSLSVLRSHEGHVAVERLRAKFGQKISVFAIEDEDWEKALSSQFGEAGREIAVRGIFGKYYELVSSREPVDYVLLPYLDYCLYAMGLLGSPFRDTKWGGICMRPSFHYGHFGVVAPVPRFSLIKKIVFLRVLKISTLKEVYTIDELLNRFVGERYPALNNKIQYVADPAELTGDHTIESARRNFGIPIEATVTLVYGAINERKGLDALIKAVINPSIPKSVCVLIVGRQSAEVQALLKTTFARELLDAGRCYVVNDFVGASVEQMAFAASDIVWLGYRGHYTMSGVLALSIKFNKRVIATKDGLIGWYANRYKLGIAVDINDDRQVRSGLLSVANADFSSSSDGNAELEIGSMDWKSLFEKVCGV